MLASGSEMRYAQSSLFPRFSYSPISEHPYLNQTENIFKLKLEVYDIFMHTFLYLILFVCGWDYVICKKISRSINNLLLQKRCTIFLHTFLYLILSACGWDYVICNKMSRNVNNLFCRSAPMNSVNKHHVLKLVACGSSRGFQC